MVELIFRKISEGAMRLAGQNTSRACKLLHPIERKVALNITQLKGHAPPGGKAQRGVRGRQPSDVRPFVTSFSVASRGRDRRLRGCFGKPVLTPSTSHIAV